MKLAFVLALTAMILAGCATAEPTNSVDAKRMQKANLAADRIGSHH